MIARPHLLVRLCLLVCCLTAVAAARKLTEKQALQLLRESPHYRELQSRVAVTRAAAMRGTLFPNPSAGVEVETAGRTDFYRFEQRLSLNGRRRLLRQAGKSAVAATQAEADYELRGIEAEVRRAFYQLTHAQGQQKSIERSLEELQELARILRAREQAGEGSKFDRLRAEREIVERETEAAEAALMIARARGRLAEYLGAGIGTGIGADGLVAEGALDPGYTLPSLPDVLMTALETRSDYRIGKARLEQLRIEAEAADRRRIPDPVITAGFMRAQKRALPVDSFRTGAVFRNGAVLGVSIDLPLFDKGQVEKQLALAKSERTRARQQVLERRILAEVRAEFEALRLRRQLAADYWERSGRKAAELRGIAEFAYQEDELGILELLDSYRVSQRARLRLLELQAAAKLAEVDFDRAIGKEMLP